VNPPDNVCAIKLLLANFTFVMDSCLVFELPVPLAWMNNAALAFPSENTSSIDSTVLFACLIGDFLDGEDFSTTTTASLFSC
jgi:hypothetical protein